MQFVGTTYHRAKDFRSQQRFSSRDSVAMRSCEEKDDVAQRDIVVAGIDGRKMLQRRPA